MAFAAFRAMTHGFAGADVRDELHGKTGGRQRPGTTWHPPQAQPKIHTDPGLKSSTSQLMVGARFFKSVSSFFKIMLIPKVGVRMKQNSGFSTSVNYDYSVPELAGKPCCGPQTMLVDKQSQKGRV